MAIGTLQAIINKFRWLTGSGTSNQITEPQIKDYINSFYFYDLPAQFRSLKLKDIYTFTTLKGIDTYTFDSERYTTVQSPCYCAKKEIKLLTDPWSFYGLYSNWQQIENFATGDGTTGPYTGTTQANPIIRSVNNNYQTNNYAFPASRVQNLLITAITSSGVTVNVTDDGLGVLYETNFNSVIPSSGGTRTNVGTIDYSTGAISITNFSQAIPSGNVIQIQYLPQNVNLPLSILFFQNQFTIRPVPQIGYTIEMVAYRQPTHVLADTAANLGTPELIEWWELIAAGAAKKFYEDRLDPDGIALMDKMLNERYSVAEARTYAQLGSERIKTIYTDQLTYNYGSGGAFGPPS